MPRPGVQRGTQRGHAVFKHFSKNTHVGGIANGLGQRSVQQFILPEACIRGYVNTETEQKKRARVHEQVQGMALILNDLR